MSFLEPLRYLTAIALLYPWLQARALDQSHEQDCGAYLLRSSVVSSMSVPEAGAAACGIRRAPGVALLNVTILKKGSQLTETLPGQVEAYAVSPAGMRRPIPMAEIRANGWISYTGAFPAGQGESLDFAIRVQPAGSSEWLEMAYREEAGQEPRPS